LPFIEARLWRTPGECRGAQRLAKTDEFAQIIGELELQLMKRSRAIAIAAAEQKARESRMIVAAALLLLPALLLLLLISP
jgi:CHASE3 domain sensor protein